MKKVKYETPVVEIIELEVEDIITSSPALNGDDEGMYGPDFVF